VKIQELKYNLYLVDFTEVEQLILVSLKAELDKLGAITIEDLPKQDYLRLLNYFTLYHVCKLHSSFEHKKNTIFYVNETELNPNVLKFVKEVKKYFPIPFYLSKDVPNLNNTAVKTEITQSLKEFRYSLDYSKYSLNKIKKFCLKFELESLYSTYKP
jgi:hypothetical protein